VHYTLRLTAVLQVYGGGVSFVVHPYVWSSNFFRGKSSTSAGSTNVTGLSAVIRDCNFSGDKGSAYTFRPISVSKSLFTSNFFLHILAIYSARSQVRASGWQRQDRMYDVFANNWARV
jgi:hypothetical protein